MVEVASRRGMVARACPPQRPLLAGRRAFFPSISTKCPRTYLSGNRLDPLACTPSYKVSAVRVTPIVAAK